MLPLELWEHMFLNFGVSGFLLKQIVKEFDLHFNSIVKIQRFFRRCLCNNTKPQAGSRVYVYSKHVKKYGTVIILYNTIIIVHIPSYFETYYNILYYYDIMHSSLNYRVVDDWADPTYAEYILKRHTTNCEGVLRLIKEREQKEMTLFGPIVNPVFL